MKVMKLPQNVFSIQKCQLPECSFIKRTYGSYCMIVIPGSLYGILVKMGLSVPKQTAAAFFMDQSVIVFNDSFRTNRLTELKDVVYQNFMLLPKALDAITINLRIVFNDAAVLNIHNKFASRQFYIKEILKLYTFAKNSVIFLDNISDRQNNGIYCIDIIDVDAQHEVEDINIYKCTNSTKVIVSECIDRKKYEMCYCCKKKIKLGGLSQVSQVLKEIIEFSKFGLNQSQKVKLVNKVLLAGPPGCGKTSLIHTVVQNCNAILLELSIPEICSSLPGETEQRLQNLFNEAKLHADNQENCVVLIEDIDVLCRKKSDIASSILIRCINKLVSLLEEFESVHGIIVIGTATNSDDVDPQLRRQKCLDDELVITLPTEEERKEIITNILEYFEVKCSKNVINNFALWTPGFVGADLHLAIQECLVLCNRTMDGLVKFDNQALENCFKKVLSNITPTSLKASVGLQVTKNVDFSKIGGLQNIKTLLDFSVKQQLLNPEIFLRLGIPLTKGILLYGPPGCAKTTLVKALAKESSMTFLSVSSADLYSPFLGDPEKKIIQLFSQARIGAPAIIFIDEIDGLVGSKSGDRMRGVQERVLSTLLVEMDGVGVRTSTLRNSSLELLCDSPKNTRPWKKSYSSNIVVIGATNRPERLDDALKRPGRFDKMVYVPPPNDKERLNILKKLTEHMTLDDSVDLEFLARVTDYYSGADIKNLCLEAAIFALTESGMTATHVDSTHFQHVLNCTRPSLNPEMIAFYENFQRNIH